MNVCPMSCATSCRGNQNKNSQIGFYLYFLWEFCLGRENADSLAQQLVMCVVLLFGSFSES